MTGKSKPFTPWRRDWQQAGYIVLFFLAGAAYLHFIEQQNVAALATLALGLTVAMPVFKRGQRRAFGARFEATLGERGALALEAREMTVTRGRMTRVGDIDLLARGKKGQATIEIKSFQRWGQQLNDRRREQKTLQQALAQQQVTHSDAAFVWLPQARPGLWFWLWRLFNRHPVIVCGSARKLARKVAAAID